MKKEIIINSIKYEILKDYRDALDIDNIEEYFTDYYELYDYVVGDWAYGKLRLKGFNEKSNSGFNKINNFQLIDEYLKTYCAYGCKYFILKKNKVEK